MHLKKIKISSNFRFKELISIYNYNIMYNNTIIMKSSIKANLKELQTYSSNPKYQDAMDEL